MPNDVFIAEVDKWLAQVRDECLRLHELGVPSERCLGIATMVADGLAIKRAQARQSLTGVPGNVVRKLIG